MRNTILLRVCVCWARICLSFRRLVQSPCCMAVKSPGLEEAQAECEASLKPQHALCCQLVLQKKNTRKGESKEIALHFKTSGLTTSTIFILHLVLFCFHLANKCVFRPLCMVEYQDNITCTIGTFSMGVEQECYIVCSFILTPGGSGSRLEKPSLDKGLCRLERFSGRIFQRIP